VARGKTAILGFDPADQGIQKVDSLQRDKLRRRVAGQSPALP